MCFLEMSEDIQKQVSKAAVQMSSMLLPAVDSLIKDKRSAKHVSPWPWGGHLSEGSWMMIMDCALFITTVTTLYMYLHVSLRCSFR